MGAEPKTKSEIRAKIAQLQERIAYEKVELASAYTKGAKDIHKRNIAEYKLEIVRLKAKLPDAPK